MSDWFKALDGLDRGKIGKLLFTSDETCNWCELEAEDGSVIVTKDVEPVDAPDPQGRQNMTPDLEQRLHDYVHEHFRAHTPADADQNWEVEYCVQGYERRYKGAASNIFPRIECADGFSLSVQGHFGAYSTPRGDFEREYSRVEVLCPKVPEFAECSSQTLNDERLYGYVPVGLVNRVIEAHGGLARANTGASNVRS